jgi:hypothetical protein
LPTIEELYYTGASMMNKHNDLSQKQLDFLSVMKAFNEPVSIDVIGTIAPLSPGDFLNLLKKCRLNKWINETSDDLFSLSNEIPEDLSRKLKKMNSREKLVKMIEILESSGLNEKIPKSAFAVLLKKSGRGAKAFNMEIDFATNALKSGEIVEAVKHIYQIEKMLPLLEESEINEAWFIPAAVEFTKYCQSRALAIRFQIKLLEKVIKKAESIGDERSQTIANMLIGRSY